MNNTKSLQAERLQELRKQHGLSQESLAYQVGTSQRQISKYESGEHQPNAVLVSELAYALNTTSDYLLGLTDIPERPIRGAGDLDELEIKLIELIRKTDHRKRQRILDVIQLLIDFD